MSFSRNEKMLLSLKERLEHCYHALNGSPDLKVLPPNKALILDNLLDTIIQETNPDIRNQLVIEYELIMTDYFRERYNINEHWARLNEHVQQNQIVQKMS